MDSDSAAFPLGREAGNHIQLHDTEVSRRHAEIRRAGEEFTVSDLDSSNGTFVNGQRIDRRELASGDQVQIGGTLMLYTGPAEEPARRPGGKIDIVGRQPSTDHSRIVRSMTQEEGSRIFDRPRPRRRRTPGSPGPRSNLQVMYRTALAVSHTLDIDQLLNRIMELIFEWVEADRGCIMLLDRANARLLTPTGPPQPPGHRVGRANSRSARRSSIT